MRSFDDVSNPYKLGMSRSVAAASRETAYTTLASNPDYRGKQHLPTKMDGYERAVVSGQVRVISTVTPR